MDPAAHGTGSLPSSDAFTNPAATGFAPRGGFAGGQTVRTSARM
jgi:hypothetical protein